MTGHVEDQLAFYATEYGYLFQIMVQRTVGIHRKKLSLRSHIPVLFNDMKRQFHKRYFKIYTGFLA
jgi:hypothetical protein